MRLPRLKSKIPTHWKALFAIQGVISVAIFTHRANTASNLKELRDTAEGNEIMKDAQDVVAKK